MAQYTRKVNYIYANKQFNHPPREYTSYKKFEQAMQRREKQFPKMIPFIRQGDRYYNFKKYEHLAREAFNGPQKSKSQGNAGGGRSIRRNSYCETYDLVIEYLYRPQCQISQRLADVERKFDEIKTQLTNRIQQASQQDSYYNKLRRQKGKTQQLDALVKRIKILFLISEPLVRKTQRSLTEPIMKQQINFPQLYKQIKKIYDSCNRSINLEIQRQYISQSEIAKIVQQTQRESSIANTISNTTDLIVLHVYTEIFVRDGVFYVSLQSNERFGMEFSHVLLIDFVRKIADIPKIYAIILSGPGMRQLQISKQSKKLFSSINFPIITVGLFDPVNDQLNIIFIQNFYRNLFQRMTLVQNYQETKKYIQKINKFTCHCLLIDQRDEKWSEIYSYMDKFTIHQFFNHSDSNKLKYFIKQRSIIEELTNFLYEANPDCFELDDEQQLYNKRVKDLNIFNKKSSKDFLQPVDVKKQTESWRTGKLQESEGINRQSFRRFRAKIMYEIIQEITHNFNQGNTKLKFLIITGPSKSGKSLFIDLVSSYINKRSSFIKCENYKEWLKQFRDKTFEQKILKRIKEKKDQRHSISGASVTNTIYKPKLVLSLGKIRYQEQKQFKQFVSQLNYQGKINKESILFICSLSQSNAEDQKKRHSNVEVYKIPALSKEQIKYLTLRNCKLKLNKQNEIIIFLEIYKAFDQANGFIEVRNEQDFIDFGQEIVKWIENVEKQYIRQSKSKIVLLSESNVAIRKNIILKQIKSYVNKLENALKKLQQNKPNLWKAIGFLCSFKEGFYLCDFNKKIALGSQDLYQQLTSKQITSQKFFRILKESNIKIETIQPEIKCLKYFEKLDSVFFQKNLNYFFGFFYSLYCFIKNHQLDFSPRYKRIFDKMGIFMYDFEPKLFQIIQKKEYQQIFKQIQQKRLTREQMDMLLEKNIHILHQFLKKINQKERNIGQEEKTTIFLIAYTMLFAGICCKYNQNFASQVNKKDLQFEMFKYIISRKDLKNDDIITLFQQILSVMSTKRPHEQIGSNKNLTFVLKALKGYEKIKSKFPDLIFDYDYNKDKDQFKNQLPETLNQLEVVYQQLKKVKDLIIDQEKCLECIVDILVTKTLVMSYLIEPNSIQKTYGSTLQAIKQVQQMIPKENNKYKFYQNTIQLCILYLQVFVSIDGCSDSQIKAINRKILPEEFIPMYDQIEKKLNPISLFRNSNIALFMKASCIRVNKMDYNYVRMNNVISSFLTRKLSSKNLNLVFWNLSYQNFQFITNNKAPQISYFVLSTDFISKQIIFEDNQKLTPKHISIDTFINSLQKIKIKFLIIFGNKSKEFYESIQSKINLQNICVIALTLDKPTFDLSTSPLLSIMECNQKQIGPLEIANNFIKVQNSQRLAQMTICCLIALLVKQKNELVTKKGVQGIVRQAIKIGKNVLQDWYNIDKNSKFNIEDSIFNMDYKIFKKGLVYFPAIQEGELKNLTRYIWATPFNFKDDAYYENVGRTIILEQIMEKLYSTGKYRKNIIQISGKRRSGKTELIKEIGWFCQTRKIFQQGVYRYNIENLNETKKMNEILTFLGPSSKNLIILLDNLEPEYINENKLVFESFFHKFIAVKSMSLVYTTKNSKTQTRIMVQNLLSGQTSDKKSIEFSKFDINEIGNIDKICLALVNIRNRSGINYGEILKSHFPDLLGLQIKNKQTQPQKLKPKPTKIGRLKTEMKMQKVKSLNPLAIPNQLQYRKISLMTRKGEEKNEDVQVDGSVNTPKCTPAVLFQDKKQNVPGVSYILDICEQFKKKEGVSQIYKFQQNYLDFDVKHMILKLEELDGMKVKVYNPLLYPSLS